MWTRLLILILLLCIRTCTNLRLTGLREIYWQVKTPCGVCVFVSATHVKVWLAATEIPAEDTRDLEAKPPKHRAVGLNITSHHKSDVLRNEREKRKGVAEVGGWERWWRYEAMLQNMTSFIKHKDSFKYIIYSIIFPLSHNYSKAIHGVRNDPAHSYSV